MKSLQKSIEVDQEKIEVVEKFPPPTSLYRCFLKEFSKIVKPLCNLLVKENDFKFSDDRFSNDALAEAY